MIYVTVEQFRIKTLLPHAMVDAVESRDPGWLDEQLKLVSSRVFVQLRKRYKQWHPASIPLVVTEWVTHVVSLRVMLKIGVRADDEQYATYKELHDTALKEVAEAANGETGLFDIALDDALDPTAIARATPMSYSEASPYVAFDAQGERGRTEDRNRGGTSS